MSHFKVDKDNTTSEVTFQLIALESEGEQGIRALTLMPGEYAI